MAAKHKSVAAVFLLLVFIGSVQTSLTDACFNHPVGVANNSIIPDNQITASTHYSSVNDPPHYGRLHGKRGNGWCSKTCCGNQDWLQVDFGQTLRLCGVATQGDIRGGSEYTTAFKVYFWNGESDWITFLNLNDDAEMEFHRSGDGDKVDQHILPEPMPTRYIRFRPTRRNRWNCLRVEVYAMNECEEQGDFCPSPVQCQVKDDGSHQCGCSEGYKVIGRGENRTCEAMNECEKQGDFCPSPVQCQVKDDGSHQCGCSEGYKVIGRGENRTCEAMNECEKQGDFCPSPVQCQVKDDGSHQCGCPEGYKLIGRGEDRTCEGQLQVLPVKNHASVCLGDSASLEVDITGALGQPTVQWSHGNNVLDDGAHFSLNENRTVLDINNVLPPHAGTYHAVVTDGLFSGHAIFNIEVYDTFLRTLVKSPFYIEFGGKGVLKVKKSDGGILWWIHRGELIRGQDSHYKFLDTKGLTGTELEISNAGLEQGGFYEVVLKEAGCEIRNVIDVQIKVQVGNKAPLGTDITEEDKLWGIIDRKYLKVFSGDFTGEWYIAPAVLGAIVILLLVFIVCLIRKTRNRKRSKKDKVEPAVTRLLFDEPLFTMQDQVYYSTTDPAYDITPVTSSHPQSSTLSAYGDISMYGSTMSPFDPRLGPPVPPPSSGLNLKTTYSAMSEEFLSDDDDDD